MELEVATEVVEVTVYDASARVTRRGRVRVGVAGEVGLLVAGLPQDLDEDSVRAAAAGPDGLRLTGAEVRWGSAGASARAEELRAELVRLEDLDREIGDRGADLKEQLGEVATMRRRGARALLDLIAAGADGVARATAVEEHLSARAATIRAALRGLAAEKRELRPRLEAARTAYEAARGGATVVRREVVVGLDVPEAGAGAEVEVTVTYLVRGARWAPLYDARLVGDRVELGYLASVVQHTGEDWPAVPLTLSTARPSGARELPDPQPWWVDLRPPAPVPRAGGPVPMPAPMMAMAAAPASGGAESTWMSEEPVAATSDAAVVDESGAARSYRAARPVAVPADGAPRRVPLAHLELEAEVDHVCAPRESADVHVRARVRNTSPLTLLPGSASVFHGEEFVGRAALELVAPGEEVELHLGVEDRVRVERELVRRESGKTGLRGHGGRTRLAYRTEVRSRVPSPVRLVLLDQVPVARDPAITVKLGDVDPRPAGVDELGLLEWRLELAPDATQVVTFEVSVEGPRDRPIHGLGV